MYRSNGNFEAYARPLKPEGIDGKKAYFVGAGLASLAGAAFLIRDAQLSGGNITIFEELALPGGSMDGILDEHKGFIIRGGREMEAHFETLWDLFRSVPSLDTPDASVLDEMYWLHKKDPSRNPCRATEGRGKPIPHMADLTLTQKAIEEMLKLALTPESELDDKRIDECFGEEFFASNFWLYWATMFAFEPWASAMEMRRYMLRFVHHIGTLADLSSLRFTRYNQYESLIRPLVAWLEGKGVHFQYDTQVENVEVETSAGSKLARRLVMTIEGQRKTIDLTENDVVFVTNGSITESSTFGDNDHPAPIETGHGGAWTLWKNLASQDPAFGRPEKFCENIPDANWTISATVTLLDDRIVSYIEKMTGRDPRDGRIVTGGPCNFKDSNWLYGYTMSRQPHFKAQDAGQKLVVWLYGLFSDKPGNYVKKTIRECTGAELCEEWLFHMGVPVEDIPALSRGSASTIPCNMPYITSYFMPRATGDRPLVVPDGSKNLAFIGNFAETEKDTVFTTEYSVRTAMEAVYTLFNVDRGVPEVFASSFDVRVLMSALYYLNDRKKLHEIELPFVVRLLGKVAMKKIDGTYVEELLKEAKLV
ncbi:oleate hydratase [Agrobacterium vitis]|uniref:oleate hydratase n=1 Tax=Agrobacterium vitis TaxID=373 RepID=UPI0012E82A34|nr:oleate hydratase [Agrobacterium vitis]MVA52641.1 oleate hydratase [Agrobacterium vitis]MVA63935.1 oleate hydratase [Agrobacterium vitis]